MSEGLPISNQEQSEEEILKQRLERLKRYENAGLTQPHPIGLGQRAVRGNIGFTGQDEVITGEAPKS